MPIGTARFFHGPYTMQLAGRFSSPRIYEIDGETRSSRPYNIWKFVITKQFRNHNDHLLELTLKSDNLFNFRDATFINPGRQYMAGIRYTFK